MSTSSLASLPGDALQSIHVHTSAATSIRCSMASKSLFTAANAAARERAICLGMDLSDEAGWERRFMGTKRGQTARSSIQEGVVRPFDTTGSIAQIERMAKHRRIVVVSVEGRGSEQRIWRWGGWNGGVRWVGYRIAPFQD